jgi:small-conductance mechanosensitive channel
MPLMKVTTFNWGLGPKGTVLKIGLVETELCGYDNIVTMIPNSQLSKVRVSKYEPHDEIKIPTGIEISIQGY